MHIISLNACGKAGMRFYINRLSRLLKTSETRKLEKLGTCMIIPSGYRQGTVTIAINQLTPS